ncbi:hypothetical protein IFR05_017568, partial [Cadophora sp. M221]
QLRMHCLCDGYLNPDDTMYICDNRNCKVYFHENHLIDDCLAKTYERVVSTDVALGVAKSTLYKGILEATIQEDTHGTPRIVITDLRPGADPKTWMELILCPKCDCPLLVGEENIQQTTMIDKITSHKTKLTTTGWLDLYFTVCNLHHPLRAAHNPFEDPQLESMVMGYLEGVEETQEEEGGGLTK